MEPMHAVKFNKMQNERYEEYCRTCRQNGIEPREQARYFPTVDVKYGYVVISRLGEMYWKKRKKDFY